MQLEIDNALKSNIYLVLNSLMYINRELLFRYH
jgi:hypothetical protein